MGKACVVSVDDLGNASDLGRLCSCRLGVVAGYQYVDVATALNRSSDGVESGAFDGRVVVFGNNKSCHGVTFK
jgi:hypothetical protein